MADLDTRLADQPTEPAAEPEAPSRAGRRTITLVLAIVIGVIVYAYAFDATGVNFDEIQSPDRQQRLVRIIRALAHPELFTYETVETNLDTQMMSPCPAGGFTPPAPDTSGPYITLEPTCVEPGGEIAVHGFNLDANRNGDILYVADSGVIIRLGEFQTDGNGEFTEVVDTRERPSEDPQTVRAVTSVTAGSVFHPRRIDTGEVDPVTGDPIMVWSPRFSQTSIDTLDKIIETVFLALIATTVGTLAAVPLSFFAARNLMRDISVPLTALSLAVIGGVVGLGAGLLVTRLTRSVADGLSDNVVVLVIALLVVAAGAWWLVRWAFPGDEEDAPEVQVRLLRLGAAVVAAVAAIIAAFLAASLLGKVGDWLADRLGALDWLGTFFTNLGEIAHLLVVALATLAIGAAFMLAGSRLGALLRARLGPSRAAPINLVLAATAGASVAIVIAQGIGWLYELTSPVTVIWGPAIVGGVLALGGALLVRGRANVRIGLSVYYVARTVFNAIRAIEPLVMVIVFVVWVGLGAFAGAIALALHTTAALAKLYSEQVESISQGPIEAVKATGATRMQTVVYAVAPQIVPPYISFTMYRWDINVRMSTIIGFAGGGGIGFLLQQNINLLNYRAAAVQMLAIAIVVASMDYLSSRLRERVV